MAALPSFSVHATDHCNYRCDNCLHFAPYRKLREYTVDEYSVHIDYMIEKGWVDSPERVLITGGEPFLHSDLPGFVEPLVDRYHFPLFLVTNGFWLSDDIDKYIPMLEKLDGLVVSDYALTGKDRQVIGRIKKLTHVAVPDRTNFVKIELSSESQEPEIPTIADRPNFMVRQQNDAWPEDACRFLYCVQLLADGRLMKCPVGYAGFSKYPVCDEVKNSKDMFFNLRNPCEDLATWRNRYPFDTCYHCRLGYSIHSAKQRKWFL